MRPVVPVIVPLFWLESVQSVLPILDGALGLDGIGRFWAALSEVDELLPTFTMFNVVPNQDDWILYVPDIDILEPLLNL